MCAARLDPAAPPAQRLRHQCTRSDGAPAVTAPGGRRPLNPAAAPPGAPPPPPPSFFSTWTILHCNFISRRPPCLTRLRPTHNALAQKPAYSTGAAPARAAHPLPGTPLPAIAAMHARAGPPAASAARPRLTHTPRTTRRNAYTTSIPRPTAFFSTAHPLHATPSPLPLFPIPLAQPRVIFLRTSHILPCCLCCVPLMSPSRPTSRSDAPPLLYPAAAARRGHTPAPSPPQLAACRARRACRAFPPPARRFPVSH